jgi:hypothetical protein
LLISIPSAFTVRKMKRVLHVLLRYLGGRVANSAVGRLRQLEFAAK